MLGRAGDRRNSRRSFARALQINPFFPEALANSGLLSAAARDRLSASRMLDRLRAISPLGASAEEHALADALRQAETPRKQPAVPTRGRPVP